jgi:Mor family transcriptional regulator|tara:strand:+ start:349 stop:639 length:291 start_codon:yes stop_codon:yes gene_type:complete
MTLAERKKRREGPVKPRDRRNPTGAFEVLPEGLVRTIQAHFHGGTIYVPVDDRIKARRDDMIMDMADAGVHFETIADKLGITSATVYTVVKRETVE